MTNARIRALEAAVARYQRSLENFAAINAELQRLPGSQRLTEILKLSESTLRSTEQLMASAQQRLERERQLAATGVETGEGPVIPQDA